MSFQQALNSINTNVNTNGSKSITGAILNSVLTLMLNYTKNSLEDTAWYPPVLSIENAEPGSKTTGDRYLVGNGVLSGDFVAKKGSIAEWDGSAWVYTEPVNFGMIWVIGTTQLLYHNGVYNSGTWKWAVLPFGSSNRDYTVSTIADFTAIGPTGLPFQRIDIEEDGSQRIYLPVGGWLKQGTVVNITGGQYQDTRLTEVDVNRIVLEHGGTNLMDDPNVLKTFGNDLIDFQVPSLNVTAKLFIR